MGTTWRKWYVFGSTNAGSSRLWFLHDPNSGRRFRCSSKSQSGARRDLADRQPFWHGGLFVLLSAPFLAAVQVLVYIGAIGILFTFAVMLTRGMTNIRERFNQQSWLSAIVAVVSFVFLLTVVILPVWGNLDPITAPLEVASVTDFGVSLVDGNQYVLPFEVASLLLTVALIGAIVIARDED